MRDNDRVNTTSSSVSEALTQHLAQLIAKSGGWLPFDAFMQAALYTPAMGYYTNGLPKLGSGAGSDFITAPEMSPLFGQCLGDQAAQIMQATETHTIYEFGAGSGQLALQICEHLAQISCRLDQYFIIEISSELRARQQQTLAHWGDRVQWLSHWPEQMHGVVIGNEVLDAMPVKLLSRVQGVWHERGVVCEESLLAWQDRPTGLRPPQDIAGEHDYLCEIHPQQEAFMRSLADRLQRGAALLIDYGFPEAEYYHPQRHMGTVMTHQQHKSGTDPLSDVGLKDITAHVNFTLCALAAQDAGLDVLGYTSQGRFLLNIGLLSKTEHLAQAGRAQIAKLIHEHEMGELFKVLAVGKGVDFELIGFTQGDRSHTL
jgi:SAM-dependent MidA family methyltransferase